MSVLISIIAFLFLLSFLVILHECGHFFAARKTGVTVEEFGFGLPPRALKIFKQGGTWFTLNWIPFGGFVRLKGENPDDVAGDQTGSFAAASYPARVLIMVAGVCMNFLLAIFIFLIGFSFGHWIPTYTTVDDMLAAGRQGEIILKPGILITDLKADYGAVKAGVPKNSLLMQIDGTQIYLPGQVSELQKGKAQVTYTVQIGPAGNHTMRSIVVPVENGITGVELSSSPGQVTAPTRSLFSAVRISLRETRIITLQSIEGIAALFQSLAQTGTVPQGITGVVGIYELTAASVQAGFMTYLRLVALLSLSLAVLNILPFPALDGGRLLFIVVEMIRRRPANRRFELITNAAGFICLLLLIGIITYYDVIRLL